MDDPRLHDEDPDARHPVDPVSAVLGVGAVAAGIAVIAEVDLYTRDLGWVVAVATVLLGLSFLPWRRVADGGRR